MDIQVTSSKVYLITIPFLKWDISIEVNIDELLGKK